MPRVYCGDRTAANDGYISWDRYPSLKKFQDNKRANLTAQEGGKVQVVIRLGEVYLIAAEAALGLRQPAEAAPDDQRAARARGRARHTRATRG